MRFAPDVKQQIAWRFETAWRAPAESPGTDEAPAESRGNPKSKSRGSNPEARHAGKAASRFTKLYARNSAGRSPQNDRRAARIIETRLGGDPRKMAARVSGAATGCGTVRRPRPTSGALIGVDFIWMSPVSTRGNSLVEGLVARAMVVDKLSIVPGGASGTGFAIATYLEWFYSYADRGIAIQPKPALRLGRAVNKV